SVGLGLLLHSIAMSRRNPSRLVGKSPCPATLREPGATRRCRGGRTIGPRGVVHRTDTHFTACGVHLDSKDQTAAPPRGGVAQGRSFAAAFRVRGRIGSLAPCTAGSRF